MTIANTEQLRGVAVVASDRGTTLGTVARALFDPATLALRALQVMGGERIFIVPWEAIETIGVEAVTVAPSRIAPPGARGGVTGRSPDLDTELRDLLDRLAAPLAAFGRLVDHTALQRRRVVAKTGGVIGMIRDIAPDSTTGRPLRLIMTWDSDPGHLDGMTTIDAAGILEIGADIVTVADPWTLTGGDESAALGAG